MTNAQLGTLGFMAPEIINNEGFTEKADVSLKPPIVYKLDIQFFHHFVDHYTQNNKY